MLGRVAVAGHSMEPLLREGDLLLYSALARPRLADVVVARDSRSPGRWIVKRVVDVSDDALELAGDAPGHERVSVPRPQVLGRVIFRYWPPARAGRL